MEKAVQELYESGRFFPFFKPIANAFLKSIELKNWPPLPPPSPSSPLPLWQNHPRSPADNSAEQCEASCQARSRPHPRPQCLSPGKVATRRIFGNAPASNSCLSYALLSGIDCEGTMDAWTYQLYTTCRTIRSSGSSLNCGTTLRRVMRLSYCRTR